MDVENVRLLSDYNGEVARGFGVTMVSRGMEDVCVRSAFLVDGETVTAAWLLESELPDVDAAIATASTLRRSESV